jgi:hypothetical protein
MQESDILVRVFSAQLILCFLTVVGGSQYTVELPHTMFLHKALLWATTFLVTCSRAARNLTIDDTFGDSETNIVPTFLPELGVWDMALCWQCEIKPEKTKAHLGTWTAATYNSSDGSEEISIEFAFTGKLFSEVGAAMILMV